MEFTHSRSKSSFENLQVALRRSLHTFPPGCFAFVPQLRGFRSHHRIPKKKHTQKKKQWRLSMDSRPVTTKVGSGVPRESGPTDWLERI